MDDKLTVERLFHAYRGESAARAIVQFEAADVKVCITNFSANWRAYAVKLIFVNF